MKLLRRAEFMALPAGTIFARGSADSDGYVSRLEDALYQKEETLVHEGDRPFENGGSDFCWSYLCAIDCQDSSDETSIWMRMLRTGESVPLAMVCQRDGGFDPKDVFLVYEQEDIIRLADALGNALRAIAGLPLYAPRHT